MHNLWSNQPSGAVEKPGRSPLLILSYCNFTILVRVSRECRGIECSAWQAEAGYPGVEGESWFAVVIPAGTPREIVALLNREINRIITLPDIGNQLAALGYEPVGTTPDDFAAQIKADMEKWGKVIRAANIKP